MFFLWNFIMLAIAAEVRSLSEWQKNVPEELTKQTNYIPITQSYKEWLKEYPLGYECESQAV